MFFSVAQQRVVDPVTGIHIEFIAQDSYSEHPDSSVVGLRIMDDETGKVVHLRFARNGLLLSLVEEETDEKGNVQRRETSAVQEGSRIIPLVGGHETIAVPGHVQTLAEREGFDVPSEEEQPRKRKR